MFRRLNVVSAVRWFRGACMTSLCRSRQGLQMLLTAEGLLFIESVTAESFMVSL